jgi:hypothetical protein
MGALKIYTVRLFTFSLFVKGEKSHRVSIENGQVSTTQGAIEAAVVCFS